MPLRTKDLPSHLADVQRRLKPGYELERTGGGHYRVLDPEGHYVEYQGKNLTLTGTGRSDAVVRMESALTASGVLKEKTPRQRTRKPPDEAKKRGIEVIREGIARRRDAANELRDRMQPWMTAIGASTPGVMWDLGRYLHSHSNGTFRNPESAAHALRNLLAGNGVKDASREAISRLSERFEAESEPMALYVEIAREVRGVETSGALGELVIPAGQEWPFTVKLIPVAACFADERYQRPPSETFVRDLVLNFDERLVGTIEVSARSGAEDGRFAILDGQTRWRAMQLVGKKRCYAAIYNEMDLAAEARFFYRVNKHRKNVHPYYGFRARVLSGEPKAVAIEHLVHLYGLKVTTHTGGSDNRGIAAVAALEFAYDFPSPHREDTLSPVLRVMGQTWTGLKKSTDAELLRGLARFYATYGDHEIVDSERNPRFQDALLGIGPQLLIARARDVGAARHRAATGFAMAKAIVGVHNQGLGRMERLDVTRLDRFANGGQA